MKFGSVPVDKAEGAILAHTLRAADKTLKKGRVLSGADIATLENARHTHVVVARLEAGDVGEDEAAGALAGMVEGRGLRAGAPFTGRSNLFSEGRGLLIVDEERLHEVNLVNEALTIATLPPFTVVEPRQIVATIKVIAFGVPASHLEACRRIAAGSAIMNVKEFRPLKVALIQTRLPGLKDSVLDKTRKVLDRRLTALGSGIVEEIRCPHAEENVANAVETVLARGADLTLIAGASAIVDRRDVIPSGIERAGGAVDHFGMPVDPGNLLLIGHHGGTQVLGLPGCARSPKFNGLDQVLQRLSAGLPLGSEDIMRMGVGGLLKEIAERPLPRLTGDAATKPSPARAPHVSALVLAAGASQRMGRINKLLAPIDGVPMVVRVVDAVLASMAEPAYVVTGYDRERVEDVLAGRDLQFVHNPEFSSGLSSSLHRGLAALPSDIDGVLVCLGDMPGIRSAHLNRLIAAFDPLEGRAICVPTFQGKRGNPVLWASGFFAEMQEVKGDVGARHLIGEHQDLVCEVELGDEGVVTDVDSPDLLVSLHQNNGSE